MSLKLYEMTAQGRELYEMLQAEEIDEQTFHDTLESIGADQKIETYCKVIRQLEADADIYKAEADAYKSESDRLLDRKKSAEAEAARMKRVLAEFLTATGQEKQAKGGSFIVSKSVTTATDIYDEDAIPEDYRKEETVIKIDRAEILKALRSGAEIPGAVLKETVGVRIR